MKLTKILLLIMTFEIIAFVYVLNMDISKQTDNDILKETSYDNKHGIRLSEVSHKDYKKIRVNFLFTKKDGKWTYLEYMSFDCNKKSKVSKSDFKIDWHDKYVKFSYRDSLDKTTQTYRIYFKDVEEKDE
ncbi:hypothetical protein HMPREF0379_0418 [[Eubacterium] yurii subsp. margaretiae ATCC 43715]|nr:hypothetical protein HMPREF0379_0418 [[Eubacterium] yurii subsp. margaretiae ATCC 43715]